MFNDLPQNNSTIDDVKDIKNDSPQKKGLLQSLHSLTFSDDDDDVTPKVSPDVTPDVNNVVNMVPEVKPVVNNDSAMGPSIGPSFSTKPMGGNISTPFSNGPVPAPKQDENVPSASSVSNSNNGAALYDTKPSTNSSGVSNVNVLNNSVKKDMFNINDLADTSVTFDTIESSLSQEMRRSIDSVKNSAQNIKDKANYELITSFGSNAKEVLIFNTFLTKEMSYTFKGGKAGIQRVNFFGVMTEKGVYAVRVSSALTSKLEDALKFTTDMRDDSIGLIGEGTSRRFVLKLPSEDYGSNNVLYIPLVGELSKQNPEAFTGLDAVEVDMQFIEDLMVLAVSEVDAMLDYEKRRRANLKALQDKTGIELKKASIISDKLSSLSL